MTLTEKVLFTLYRKFKIRWCGKKLIQPYKNILMDILASRAMNLDENKDLREMGMRCLKIDNPYDFIREFKTFLTLAQDVNIPLRAILLI